MRSHAADGRLSTLDELRLLLDVLRARLPGRARPSTRLEVELIDAVRRPEGALARAADQAMLAVTPGWLAGHLRRTYTLAAAFARHDGIAHDAELLYAAALLHDLGLVAPHAAPGETCFAVHGAEVAYEIARRSGADELRARRLRAAIALHLEVRVSLEQGAEAHLLHAGAACDVLGARLGRLSRSARARVLELHPREDFASWLARAMRKEAARAPRTRAGLYCRRFDFAARIERSPWEVR